MKKGTWNRLIFAVLMVLALGLALFMPQSVRASDDIDEGVPSDGDVVRKIAIGQTYQISEDENTGGYIWFTFTAKEEDKNSFVFKADEDPGDTYFELFDSTGEPYKQMRSENQEISFTSYVIEDQKYFLRVKTESSTGFSVVVKKAQKITVKKITGIEPVKTTFVAGYDCLFANKAEIRAEYSDGTDLHLTIRGNYAHDYDTGIKIYAHVRDPENGEEIENTISEPGTYEVYFTANGEELESGKYNIEVKDVTDMELPELETGGCTIDTTKAWQEARSWYRFVPDESGTYVFGKMPVNPDPYDDDEQYMAVYRKTDNGIEPVQYGDDRVALTAGNTYFFAFYGGPEEEAGPDEWATSFYRIREIASVNITSMNKTVFAEGIDDEFLVDANVELVFTDGTKASEKYSKFYGLRYLDNCTWDYIGAKSVESGEIYDITKPLAKGVYDVCFVWEDGTEIIANGGRFEVKSASEMDVQTLNENESWQDFGIYAGEECIDVDQDDKYYWSDLYKLVPTSDGRCTMSACVMCENTQCDMEKARIYDVTDSGVSRLNVDSFWKFTVNVKKGHTYYIRFGYSIYSELCIYGVGLQTGYIETEFSAVRKNAVLSGATGVTIAANREYYKLGVSLTEGDGALSYSSSDMKIATVDSKGKVSVKGVGTVYITVTSAQTAHYNKAQKKVKLVIIKPSVADLTAKTTHTAVTGVKDATYTGKAITMSSLKVTAYGATLTNGKDYTVSYKNNKNAGTATITITGKNGYKGTVKKTFNISIPKGRIYESGGLKYKVTSSAAKGSGTVTLTGTTYKASNRKFKTLTVKNTVSIGGKTFKVTAIGQNAFKGYKYLTKAAIGANVQTIGAGAFSGCSGLKSITISTAKLTSKSVGANAFARIYAKANVKVPAKQLTAYKKLLKQKGLPAKAVVKK